MVGCLRRKAPYGAFLVLLGVVGAFYPVKGLFQAFFEACFAFPT